MAAQNYQFWCACKQWTVCGVEARAKRPLDRFKTVKAEFWGHAGNCWVLADNEELRPPAVVDSRTFGPLPVENIMGRVIYYARKNDHGPVENSRPAMSADAAVLEAELDLDKLQAS